MVRWLMLSLPPNERRKLAKLDMNKVKFRQIWDNAQVLILQICESYILHKLT